VLAGIYQQQDEQETDKLYDSDEKICEKGRLAWEKGEKLPRKVVVPTTQTRFAIKV